MSAPHEQTPHLVNLKVLRASRPTLAPHPPLHGLDTAGPGGDALRQLGETEKGGMLALPSNFGVIYLGETFSAVLSLSNDLPPSPSSPDSVAHSVSLAVEIHTGLTPQGPTAKHFLARVEARTEDGSLAPGQSLDTMAVHELKELGAHALVCTATYGAHVLGEDGVARMVNRTLRKVYKFQVTNPISLRTKALAPTPASPTSFLSPTERAKIFLEVQIQNHCDSSMWFERMRFETLPGFTLADQNDGLYEGAEALLPPGGLRQFLYILQAGPEVPIVAPGASQGLGRIDIGWRTRNGELGRLLSSTLGSAFGTDTASRHVTCSAAHPDAGRLDGCSHPAFPTLSRWPRLRPYPLVDPVDRIRLVFLARRTLLRQPPPDRLLRAFSQPSTTSPAPTSGAARPPTATLSLPGSLPVSQPLSAPPSVTSLQQQQHLRPSTDSLSRTSLDSIRSSASPAPPLATSPFDPLPVLHGIQLPRSVPIRAGPPIGPLPSPGVMRLGSEVVDSGEVVLGDEEDAEAVKEFRVRYVPLETGLIRVGGLRVLLLENEEDKEGGLEVEAAGERGERMASVVWETETIAEVWVE
ncbi:hypothetical protein BJY59DRAFT_499549 [Rhodotorula toruloides]